jgi:hypothetical protein
MVLLPQTVSLQNIMQISNNSCIKVEILSSLRENENLLVDVKKIETKRKKFFFNVIGVKNMLLPFKHQCMATLTATNTISVVMREKL